MRQLLPAYVEDVDLVEAYAYPPDRPWVRANMVSSLDGAAAVRGRSEALSTPADKLVFGLLRGLCDVVLVGAGTARAEGYRAPRAKPAYAQLRASHGQPPAPVLALVSRSLDLDPASQLFHGGDQRTVVVTCAASDERARARLADVADVVVAGGPSVDLRSAVGQLSARGLRRALCEGGPSLLADLVAAECLDELCLTLSPRFVGDAAPRITSGSAADDRATWHAASVLEEDDTLLLRYRRA
jgi:riboflavin biosynthesis pyrimidine reductase